MKTLKDCLSLVRALEARFPVLEWSLGGVRVWPLIRTLLFYRLTLSLRGPEARPPTSKLARLVDAFTAPLRDPGRNLGAAAPAEAFILTYAGIRQARVGGRCMDIRTGPVLEALAEMKVPTHAWEYAAPSFHRFPRKNPTHLVQGGFYAAQLGNRLWGPRPDPVRLPDYAGFCAALRGEGALHPELHEPSLLREFGLILSLAARFERAFDRINPLVAFSSNMGRYEFALNLACRRRNIPTVELQHGVQGPLHGQYAGWDAVPAEGFDLLPAAYWCWDETSASTINEWSDRCAPRHHAVAGGIPWVEYCAGLASPDLPSTPGRKLGLITLQPPGKVYADLDPVPGFLLDALAKTDKIWTWWIRPHPASEGDFSPLQHELKRRGIEAEIERIRTIPLPQLLGRADLHLTHSSSAVLEAERFKVASIVWSELGADLYSDAIRSGTCRAALDAEALVQAISRTAGAPVFQDRPRTPPCKEMVAQFVDLGRRMKAERKR